MRPVYWDPFIPVGVYWPGFWVCCNRYWYDWHCTDVVVVREYVRENYHTDLVTYVVSGDLMYALIVGEDGRTYLQVFDKSDNLLAQHPVSSDYCLMEIDKDNGGCWIMKKDQSVPLLFLFDEGKLLIYETED